MGSRKIPPSGVRQTLLKEIQGRRWGGGVCDRYLNLAELAPELRMAPPPPAGVLQTLQEEETQGQRWWGGHNRHLKSAEVVQTLGTDEIQPRR